MLQWVPLCKPVSIEPLTNSSYANLYRDNSKDAVSVAARVGGGGEADVCSRDLVRDQG
jgi:hypothetical protein